MPGRSLYSFAQATHQSVNDYLPGTLLSPHTQPERQSGRESGEERPEMLKTCLYLTKGTGASPLLEMDGSPGKKNKESFLLSFFFLIMKTSSALSGLSCFTQLLWLGVFGVVTVIPPSRTPEETRASLDNQPGVKNDSLGGK